MAFRSFRLRTMLIAVGVLCLGLGGWVSQVRPYQQQAAAIRVIEKCDGEWLSRPANPLPILRFLTPAAGRQWVEHVDLQGASLLSEAELRSLAEMIHQPLWSLRWNSSTREEVFGALSALNELQNLRAPYCGVTDKEVASLGRKPDLEVLVLTGCPVTDESIDTLSRNYPRLSELYIRWTAISLDGAKRLRQRLPECEVYYRPRPTESAAVADRTQ